MARGCTTRCARGTSAGPGDRRYLVAVEAEAAPARTTPRLRGAPIPPSGGRTTPPDKSRRRRFLGERASELVDPRRRLRDAEPRTEGGGEVVAIPFWLRPRGARWEGRPTLNERISFIMGGRSVSTARLRCRARAAAWRAPARHKRVASRVLLTCASRALNDARGAKANARAAQAARSCGAHTSRAARHGRALAAWRASHPEAMRSPGRHARTILGRGQMRARTRSACARVRLSAIRHRRTHEERAAAVEHPSLTSPTFAHFESGGVLALQSAAND